MTQNREPQFHLAGIMPGGEPAGPIPVHPPTLNIIGCTVVDVLLNNVARLPRWPNHSEFTSKNLVLLNLPPMVTIGGNGANAAFVASSLGTRVELYSCVGDDEMGRIARRWLRSVGCRIHSPDRVVATACNVTAANDKHRRATFFYPGIRPKFPRMEARAGEAVLVCGWPHPPLDVVAREFRRLRRAGVLTALDLGPILGPIWAWAELEKVLHHTSVLLGNRHEILALTGQRRVDNALSRVRRVCPGDIVIKLGSGGALWSSPSTPAVKRMAARKVRAINTVGAGDSFNGALLAALLVRQQMAQAVRAALDLATDVVACGGGVLGSSATFS